MIESLPFLPKIIEIIRSKEFLVIFGLSVAILSITTINSSLAQQSNGYFALTTLGQDMQADDYFLQDDHLVRHGDKQSWHIAVHNGMDNAEFVSIRVKLLNSTQLIPNDSLNQPSPEPPILELRQMLAENSTSTIPLDWSIKQADTELGYVTIKEITINGQDISNLNIRSLDGQNFKVVLELWRYDHDSNSFAYAWSSGHDMRSVWNQIWFNVET